MTCVKARVFCTITITTPGGLSVTGENWCRQPQSVCPREPGEGYEKCRTVCAQVGHAETDALSKAAEAHIDVTGATAVLRGHTYMCQACQEALYGAGVQWLGRA